MGRREPISPGAPRLSADEWDRLAERVVPGRGDRPRARTPGHVSPPRRHVGRDPRPTSSSCWRARPAPLVKLCWDVGHALYGGIDPVDVVRRHPERIAYLHLKDVDGAVLEGLRRDRRVSSDGIRRRVFTELGRGMLDVPGLLAALRRDRLRRLADGRAGFDLAGAHRERARQPRVSAQSRTVATESIGRYSCWSSTTFSVSTFSHPVTSFGPDAQIARAWRMEAHLLWVRALIIVLNAVLFLVSVGSDAPMYQGALYVIVLSAAYAAGLLAFKPYLRWPVLSASLFTTVIDSVFVTLWVLVTGGPDSPYYLLYHISVASIAIRFSLRESLLAAAAYTVSYSILVLATTADMSLMVMPLVIRTSYMWFIGLIVGRLASEERDRAGETREILRLHEELAQAQTALEEQALQDALTACSNRRHFDTCLAAGVQSARQQQHHWPVDRRPGRIQRSQRHVRARRRRRAAGASRAALTRGGP